MEEGQFFQSSGVKKWDAIGTKKKKKEALDLSVEHKTF